MDSCSGSCDLGVSGFSVLPEEPTALCWNLGARLRCSAGQPGNRLWRWRRRRWKQWGRCSRCDHDNALCATSQQSVARNCQCEFLGCGSLGHHQSGGGWRHSLKRQRFCRNDDFQFPADSARGRPHAGRALLGRFSGSALRFRGTNSRDYGKYDHRGARHEQRR